MDFIPYSRQDIEDADRAAVLRVLGSDFLTQGPEIAAFEQEFAERHQVPHAVAVSNATAALHIACLALDVRPGSLVWTVPNTFVASALNRSLNRSFRAKSREIARSTFR